MNEVLAEQVRRLEEQHQGLARQVERLERRAYLTPSEQLTMAQLKKQKLLTKDQLFAARQTQ